MPAMLRKALAAVGILVAALITTGGALYLANATPEVPPLTAATLTDSSRPWVVKLHAQWCPICMLTKGEWAEIEATYADRVNLLVFDSTSKTTMAASRAEAGRLGLDTIWDTYAGATGVILVLDGAKREIVAELAGNLSFDDYRAAIDAILDAG